MNSNTRTLTIGVAVLMLATAMNAHPRGQESGSGADFERFSEMRERRQEDRLERLTELLDLDAGQKAQVEEILTVARARHQEARKVAKSRHDELKALLDSGSANEAEVGALVIEMHQFRTQMKSEREQIHFEISALLTPEQQERFEVIKDLHSERGERRHGRRGRGPRGPGRR